MLTPDKGNIRGQMQGKVLPPALCQIGHQDVHWRGNGLDDVGTSCPRNLDPFMGARLARQNVGSEEDEMAHP